MTKKPSRFGGGGAYATVKQRILDKLKAFYERFAGMGAWLLSSARKDICEPKSCFPIDRLG